MNLEPSFGMMIRKYSIIPTVLAAAAISLTLVCCQEPADKSAGQKAERPAPPKWEKPASTVSYTIESGKVLMKRKDSVDAQALKVIQAVNRVDLDNIANLDSVLVPSISSGDLVYYLPFPLEVSGIKDIRKIIFFSYPTQTFGAYEYGNLVYTGPTNMGREKDQTPPGLYFTNWKAETTTSTFDDEWELKWNFNVENKEGIGWHQYALPGYPASHSCLRLLEADAKHLYNWADEWKLKSKDSVELKGTPVIVYGSYPFGSPKPWLALKDNPKALDIPASLLEEQVNPHMQAIMQEQEKREQKKGEESSK